MFETLEWRRREPTHPKIRNLSWYIRQVSWSLIDDIYIFCCIGGFVRQKIRSVRSKVELSSSSIASMRISIRMWLYIYIRKKKKLTLDELHSKPFRLTFQSHHPKSLPLFPILSSSENRSNPPWSRTNYLTLRYHHHHHRFPSMRVIQLMDLISSWMKIAQRYDHLVSWANEDRNRPSWLYVVALRWDYWHQRTWNHDSLLKKKVVSVVMRKDPRSMMMTMTMRMLGFAVDEMRSLTDSNDYMDQGKKEEILMLMVEKDDDQETTDCF